MKTLVGRLKSIIKSDSGSGFLSLRLSLRQVAILLSFLLAVCLIYTGAWAQGVPASKPIQSPLNIPVDLMPPQTGIKGDNADLSSADRDAQKKMDAVQEKYKSELKKDCISLPDNLNINENIPFSVMQVIDQYKGEPCEMMNEIKFHVDEKRGKNAGQIAWEMIKIFVIPDEGDAAELFAKIFAKHAVPVAGIYSKFGDAAQFIELIDSEIVTNRLHGQYMEAVNKYRSSKGWNMAQLQNETGSLYTDLKRKLRDVEKLESELYSECMKQYPSDQELAAYGPPFKPGTKIPNDAMIWRQYYEKIEPIEQKYDSEIRTKLRDIVGIELKIKLLENYRKPLIEKPCDQRIEAAKQGCPQKKKSDDVARPPEPPKNAGSLSQTDKNALNGCLCRCTIDPTIGVGATYDPNAWKNASPSCDDARNGPCVGFGLGCWRKHMDSAGECFEQCVKNAGADKQKTISEINRIKLDAFNDFIKEARGIIEEYIKFIPGAYQKKTSQRDGNKNGGYLLLAMNFSDKVSDGDVFFAAAATNVPMTYIEMIKEKNRRGDPDKALGLLKAAESIIPDRKGELQNVLAEFAIMMSKASLNIVTELEFDEGLYLLRKAAEFYPGNKANSVGDAIIRLTGNFEKWKKDWQVLKNEVPNCLELIKDKGVCACNRLHNEKILPAANSLTIYEFASSEKWSVGAANGTPRAIPEKDKIYNELKDRLYKELDECAKNPVMYTKEMKDLTDYDTRRSLEKSQYINQEDLKKFSAPVICATRVVKYAEKLLSAPGLCDCQQEKIKGILDMAKKEESPLVIEFGADKKELSVGDRVMLSLSIKGGLPPFSADMIGDYPYNQRSEARGFSINYQAEKTGTNNFYVTVVDSCGDSGSKKVSINVKPAQGNVDKIKPKDKQAQQFANEGYALEKKGDLAGAIRKYQEAVKIVSDKGTSEHIAELQRKIKDEEARKETALKTEQGRKDKQAQQLANEGYALEKKGDLSGAIKKYQETVKIVPDKGTTEHIAELQKKIKEEETRKKDQKEKATSAGFPSGVVWRFGRADGSVIAERIILQAGGKIQGYHHSNEDHWGLESGKVVFYNPLNQAVTRFSSNVQEGGVTVLRGAFLPDPAITHVLREVDKVPALPGVSSNSGSWEYVGIGDCPGNDIAGGGAGSVPNPQVCDSRHAGLAAVCWDSKTPRVMSPPSCTIKSVRAENCTGGVNPGRMYRCAFQAGSQSNSTQPIGPENSGVRIGPMEMNTDRMGADIRSFDLQTADPTACRTECARTRECTAWTYVKPDTKQGPRPRCWLKHSSPGKNPDPSCISGVIERDPLRQK